jgi:hypothetical protein
MSRSSAEEKDFQFPVALKKFYWAAIVAATLMIAAYIANFAFETLRFSGDPDDWGVFGDYIGGTLGTFFGFAAFVGVLVTIAIQRQQLEHARKQAYLDELQRFLSDTAARIDVMLNREVEVGQVRLLQRFANANRRVTLHSLIASVGNVKAGMLDTQQVDQSALQAAIEDITTELPVLLAELEFIAVCMRTYCGRGGDSDIVKLYRLRYNHLVGWLYIADLSRNEAVMSQFPISEFVEQMKRVSGARQKAAGPQS